VSVISAAAQTARSFLEDLPPGIPVWVLCDHRR